MKRLFYIANFRLPTEKAHGLQVIQNCEAFADAGLTVELWVPRRFNTAAMRQINDVYTHYGVNPNFAIRYLPTLDLLPLVPDRVDRVARLVFYIQLLTFLLAVCFRLPFTPSGIIYTRDPRMAAVFRLFVPSHRLVYEAHQLAEGRSGTMIQRWAVRGAGHVISITQPLRDDLLKRSGAAHKSKFHVAHDGVQHQRFARVPSQDQARQRIGWEPHAFLIGYVGRLHTMQMDKGVGTLAAAVSHLDGATLVIVGGPDDRAVALQAHWLALGMPQSAFVYVPQVPPDQVPIYMAALDVCVIPTPFVPYFAYHTSPLKLFEYLASGSAVVATNLPAWSDVLTHEENALLVPPSDDEALTAALQRLRHDPHLKAMLGANGREQVLKHYTWTARANAILAHIQREPV